MAYFGPESMIGVRQVHKNLVKHGFSYLGSLSWLRGSFLVIFSEKYKVFFLFKPPTYHLVLKRTFTVLRISIFIIDVNNVMILFSNVISFCSFVK